MAGLIEQYVAALKRDLAFDRALAARLGDEVEGHLRDAAEADRAWPSPQAEQRAIERFGLAREIAAQCAADAVNRQARRTWVALSATVAVTFLAMRLRVTWLADVGDSLSVLAPLIDRYAFVAALAIAAAGWLLFRRSILLLAACVTALGASIAAGIFRAGLLAAGAPLHVLLTAAAEIALIGLLLFHVVSLGRSLRRTALLRRPR
jgi:hypothetical protein